MVTWAANNNKIWRKKNHGQLFAGDQQGNNEIGMTILSTHERDRQASHAIIRTLTIRLTYANLS